MTPEHIALLAQQSQQGNLDSFSKLITHFEKPLLRYIQRISSFRFEEAEEVLQESFLKTWRYIHEYDTSFAFSTWIYRIVHQMTISEWRKQVSRGREFEAEWDQEHSENIASMIDTEQDLISQETKEHVRKAISYLPDQYRQVLVLKSLEQKSYEEISDILKIPIGTAGSLVSRAKSKLKHILESSFGYKSFSV